MTSLDEAIAQALAEVLDELLHRQGWTVARLAKATGLSRQTLHSWVGGIIADPRYTGIAKLFFLANRSLDLLPITSKEETPLTAQDVRSIVSEQLAQARRGGLRLEIQEQRPANLNQNPARLQESVKRVQNQIAQGKTLASKNARRRIG